MKISYAITVCNELLEIQRLLPFLIENKRKQDEIVVFYDTNNSTEIILAFSDNSFSSTFLYRNVFNPSIE